MCLARNLFRPHPQRCQVRLPADLLANPVGYNRPGQQAALKCMSLKIWHTHIKQSGSQIRDIDSLLALLAWLTHIEDSSLGRNGPAQNAGLAR